MHPDGVRKSLLQNPEKPKEIRMNDGSRFVVRSREHWITAAEYLIVLDTDGCDRHIAYRNIAWVGPVMRGRRLRA